ncbi:hypothetical protein LINPERHAP1_LOCUS37557 [Linum perenne]
MRPSEALVLLPLFIEKLPPGGNLAEVEMIGDLEESAKASFHDTKTNTAYAHPWSSCLVVHLDMGVRTP